MPTEKKEVSVLLADQEKTIAKLKKDGWKHASYAFAKEGATHCLLKFEREKKK